MDSLAVGNRKRHAHNSKKVLRITQRNTKAYKGILRLAMWPFRRLNDKINHGDGTVKLINLFQVIILTKKFLC